ncbi:AMP-binding protein [Plesiomonas shigelloides]|uniref:AMP-binding protein n=1 Tax=Plesiomonas shigelloides TaxID=703 RepID=UPI000DD5139C|nr:AMP-binding protein [Plesiomonas shigelloides]
MLLFTAIRQHAQLSPERIALQDAQHSLSYAQLWQRIQLRATELQAHHVRRLAIALDNGIEWALTDLSALYAGITVIPVPHFFSASQQEWLLHTSQTDSLLTSASSDWSSAGILTPAIDSEGSDTASSTSGEISSQLNLLQCHLPQDHAPHHQCDGHSTKAEIPSAADAKEFTAKITFTSGTTGQPKGVCLSNQHLMRTTQALADAVSALDIQRHLTVLPLTTLLENITGLYVPLLLGATSLLPSLAEIGFQGSSRLEPQQFLRCLQTFRPHSMVLVPELLRLLLALAPAAADSLSELRFIAVGGGRVAASLLQQAQQLNLPVYQGYGLSECGSVVSLNTPQGNCLGSAGRPLPHCRVRLADDGEILVSGGVMQGYLLGDSTRADSSNATEAANPADNAPVHGHEIATGDLGYLDDNGFLHITGRKKNVQINAFGRNFSPEWIESEAQICPAIRALVLYGDALPSNVALIDVMPGQEHALAAQLSALNQGLPDYAQISHWIVSEPPLSANPDWFTRNGRPRRDVIFQHYQDQIVRLATGDAQ